MEDPKRMLHGGADRLERELLESVRDVSAPAGAKDRAFEALLAQLAAATVVGGAVSTAKAAGALANATGPNSALTAKLVTAKLVTAKLVTAKLVTVAIVGGMAVGGGIWAFKPVPHTVHRERAKVAARNEATRKQELAEVSVEINNDEATKPAAKPAAKARAGERSRDALRESALLRESVLLQQARARLKEGDAAAAQALLDRLESEFPVGVLRQEREVLEVSVLSARGQHERAQRRAKAFVKAHPESPHSASLRELLKGE